MGDGYCGWMGCRQISSLGYQPTTKHKKVELCWDHWMQVCDAEGGMYGEAMKQLGYVDIRVREHYSQSNEGDAK